MTVMLIETPTIDRRGDAAVVIFPSRPYWFSATGEIVAILEAFKLAEPAAIVADIASRLAVDQADAANAYHQTKELLFKSGVLAIDGQTASAETFSPNFQVNEVENVMVIATTQGCNMACPMCYAHARHTLPNEMTTTEITDIVDQLSAMSWKNSTSRVALTGGELFTQG